MKKIYSFGILALFSCSQRDSGTIRAYIEGKISSNQNPEEIILQLISNGKPVAGTSPSPDKTFVISGPLFAPEFSILFNCKIQSFHTDRKDLRLSPDSLQILVPAGISYLKFNTIQLKQ